MKMRGYLDGAACGVVFAFVIGVVGGIISSTGWWGVLILGSVGLLTWATVRVITRLVEWGDNDGR